MKFIAALLLFVLPTAALAQNSVTGQVIDSLTRKPVPFANIYFAGTTIGTMSREDGSFELTGFPSGKYDLTASFVGYHPAQAALAFESTRHRITFVLLEKATQLAEVVVRPDDRNRVHNLATFKNAFLGQTKNSASTKIKNEDELDFDFDNMLLTAFARKPLEIVNNALGYKVVYDLQGFEIDYQTNIQFFVGIPRFENLSDKLKPRWVRERKRAYYGSMMHLIHLLMAGNLGNDFTVYEFFRNPNPDRPPTALLQEKIKYWSGLQLSENGTFRKNTAASDSLNYYLNLKRLPELIDSIGRKITDVSMLLNAERNTITYTGLLYVIYNHEPEEPTYALQQRRAAQPNQTTIIHIYQPVKIYDNGYFEDLQNIFFEGYLGWSEKLAGLLPLGYRPEP